MQRQTIRLNLLIKKPVPGLPSRMMAWAMSLEELFNRPGDLPKDLALRRGMTIMERARSLGHRA